MYADKKINSKRTSYTPTAGGQTLPTQKSLLDEKLDIPKIAPGSNENKEEQKAPASVSTAVLPSSSSYTPTAKGQTLPSPSDEKADAPEIAPDVSDSEEEDLAPDLSDNKEQKAPTTFPTAVLPSSSSYTPTAKGQTLPSPSDEKADAPDLSDSEEEDYLTTQKISSPQTADAPLMASSSTATLISSPSSSSSSSASFTSSNFSALTADAPPRSNLIDPSDNKGTGPRVTTASHTLFAKENKKQDEKSKILQANKVVFGLAKVHIELLMNTLSKEMSNEENSFFRSFLYSKENTDIKKLQCNALKNLLSELENAAKTPRKLPLTTHLENAARTKNFFKNERTRMLNMLKKLNNIAQSQDDIFNGLTKQSGKKITRVADPKLVPISDAHAKMISKNIVNRITFKIILTGPSDEADGLLSHYTDKKYPKSFISRMRIAPRIQRYLFRKKVEIREVLHFYKQDLKEIGFTQEETSCNAGPQACIIVFDEKEIKKSSFNKAFFQHMNRLQSSIKANIFPLIYVVFSRSQSPTTPKITQEKLTVLTDMPITKVITLNPEKLDEVENLFATIREDLMKQPHIKKQLTAKKDEKSSSLGMRF